MVGHSICKVLLAVWYENNLQAQLVMLFPSDFFIEQFILQGEGGQDGGRRRERWPDGEGTQPIEGAGSALHLLQPGAGARKLPLNPDEATNFTGTASWQLLGTFWHSRRPYLPSRPLAPPPRREIPPGT